ncbi:MAG: FecR domain-containing protein [Candidatus Eremiobacteraeota bacterium]|nr:FecR domain-containing protein [Candidatus Eremiobacteraeota bacterium]
MRTKSIAALLVVVAWTTAFPRAAAAEPDPHVARVSQVDGSASQAPNTAVQTGDDFTTPANSRAEIQLDAATMLRIDQRTQVVLENLDPARRQLRLVAGTIQVRLFRDPDGELRVVTPAIAVVAQTAGTYRIDVASDGSTLVTVRSGRAAIPMRSGQLTVLAGRALVARPNGSSPSISYEVASAPDDFDRWSDGHDAGVREALGANYLSPAIAGNELGAYGRWLGYPGYGQVWSPYAAAGWAPYTQGTWAWTNPYGWTWVGSEPWGWAPYHYGRWIYDTALGWLWVPGVYAPWAPALVGFYGSGVGYAGWSPWSPNVSWVALAPNEPYHPWWGWRARPGGTIVTNNFTNYANLRQVYRNTHPSAPAGSTTLRFVQTGSRPPQIAPPLAPVHLDPPARRPAVRLAPPPAPASRPVAAPPPPATVRTVAAPSRR